VRAGIVRGQAGMVVVVLLLLLLILMMMTTMMKKTKKMMMRMCPCLATHVPGPSWASGTCAWGCGTGRGTPRSPPDDHMTKARSSAPHQPP
jgi:hypothetical protein